MQVMKHEVLWLEVFRLQPKAQPRLPAGQKNNGHSVQRSTIQHREPIVPTMAGIASEYDTVASLYNDFKELLTFKIEWQLAARGLAIAQV